MIKGFCLQLLDYLHCFDYLLEQFQHFLFLNPTLVELPDMAAPLITVGDQEALLI